AVDYMHRIGRTGRADKQGVAISFVTEKEMPLLESAEQLMNRTVNRLSLPEPEEVSDQLIEDEMEKPHMPEIQLKRPDPYSGGGAFHEKSAKNKKVNITISKKERMMRKYGKPIKKRRK